MENGSIIYSPYIPMSLSQEALKMLNAGKTFATIKSSNRNTLYRRRSGEVKAVTDGDDGKRVLLRIEVKTGYDMWKSADVWFGGNELEDFRTFDKKGDKVLVAKSLAELIVKAAVMNIDLESSVKWI